MRRFLLHIVFGVAVGVVLFLFRESLAPSLSISSPERIGMVGRFTSDSLPLVIQEKLSTGITKLGPDGAAAAGISSSWESKEDGRVWTFTIDPNLRWQDNSVITSKDIRYSFPDTRVIYPDTQKIEFHLKDPYTAFPILVSRPIFKKGLLGNRNWKVKKINFDGQLIRELLIEDKETLEQEFYRFYESEQNLRLAFKLGEVDKIFEISNAKEFFDWKNIKIDQVLKEQRFVGIFLNNDDPRLSDKSFRQALAYAIDKNSFGQNRALSSVSPLSWAYNPLVKEYEYNPTRAKELFNQIKREQQPKTIMIATIPSLLDVAEVVAKGWREVFGIEVVIQVAAGIPENFQALLATQEIPPDPDQYSMWHSTQKETNITHYNSPRVDKLLEDGRRTLDIEGRRRIYIDFQRFLVEELPVIFLYHPITYTISRK